jgi:uncharacterized protein with HEPN domain
MSPRKWQARIQDIIEAIREIQAFTREMDFAAFAEDAKTIRAVELNFIIIGEAANDIPNEVEEARQEIPWYYMRAMRNRLVHVYFDVDPMLVWDTIQSDLPKLLPILENLISKP